MKFKYLKMPIQKIFLFFVLVLTLTLSSCEKDLYDTSNTTDSKFIVNTISFKDLKNKSATLLKIVNKLEKKEKLINSKMVFDSINNFYIEEDSIKEIKSGEYESYTLAIKRDESDKVENLLFSKNEEGNYDIFIVEYGITADQLESAKETGFIGDVKYNHYEMDENGLLTNRYMQVICVTTGSYQWVSHQSFTTQQPTMYYEFVVSSVSCTFSYDNSNGSGGGNSSSGSTYNNGQTSGSSGNGSSNYNGNTTTGVYGNGGLNGTGIYTIPIAPKMTSKQIKIAFAGFLNNPTTPHLAELSWWNNSSNNIIAAEILAYLTANQTLTVDEPTPFEFALESIIKIRQNPTVFTSFKPFVIVKRIRDSQLDPCGKSVLNRLKNNQQVNLANILSRFGSSSTYTLNINSAFPTSQNAAFADTYWVLDSQGNEIPFNYNINISPNETAASSDLAIAGTLLHEILHAYFLSLIDDCRQSGNCTTLQTFPDLWNFYVTNQNGGIFTDNVSQHQQIAMNFVNIMASALQEFDTGTPSATPLQVYIDVAWYGLKGTIPYDALPQSDRTRMEFRFESVELLNQNGIDSNGQTITPEGTRANPC